MRLLLLPSPSSQHTVGMTREAHACRVENFIERDDEPTLRVLTLRILFLHITSKLVLLA